MAMEFSGEERIAAPIERVWEALNNPEVLSQAIPGCQSLTMTSPTEMSAVVAISIGPIKARFSGEITLNDINPPRSYRIEGEGKGGIAGFAKGGATVELTPDGDEETILTYSVSANVGGKLAQLGSRMIMSTAKKLSGEFFAALNRIISAPVA